MSPIILLLAVKRLTVKHYPLTTVGTVPLQFLERYRYVKELHLFGPLETMLLTGFVPFARKGVTINSIYSCSL